jgi:hypothetical protein
MKYCHLYHSHIFATGGITDSNWRTLSLISLSAISGSICLYIRIVQDAHPRVYLTILANPPDDTNSLNSIVIYVHVILTILSITMTIIVAILAYFMNNCSNTINAPAIVEETCINTGGIDMEILLTFGVAITFGMVGIFAIGIRGVFQGLNPFIMGVLLPAAIICSHKRMKIQGTKLAGNIMKRFHCIKSKIIFWKSTSVHPQQPLIELNC